MPWKECSVMDERLRFVSRLLDGESMTDVCREFGISRKTGYKIFSRYKEHGFEALNDRCAIIPIGFCYPRARPERGLAAAPGMRAFVARAAAFQVAASRGHRLTGRYAQRHFLGPRCKGSLAETVRASREYAPEYFPLPHPSQPAVVQATPLVRAAFDPRTAATD